MSNILELLNDPTLLSGKLQEKDKGLPVDDPATGLTIGWVPACSDVDVKTAIDAAATAFPDWSAKTGKDRAQVLRRWFDLIIDHQEDLARIMSAEQGKPLAESRGEVLYGASFIEWFAEEAKRIYGDTIPATSPDKRIITLKQPIGVVAAITPWNFPSAMITRKAGPALAVGCTMVLKPASATPMSALALEHLAHLAGIPRDVFRVVTSNSASSVGKEFATNPKISKLTFTGSTEVGRALLEQSASTVKKVSMELGGNAPFIVFDDADLDAAVKGAIASKFRNTGQTCVCANRLLVQSGVYDAFAQKLATAVEKMTVGPAMSDAHDQGPLINAAAIEKVNEHIADATAKGAKVRTGGEAHDLGGNFYKPTVLTDVTSEMLIAAEETFGPVAPLFRFETEEEAIRLANATEFGLAAYFYAQDVSRVWRVAEAIEAGMVGINEGIISTEVAPFGGVKQSGLGREGARYGADDYLELKYLCFGGINSRNGKLKL